MARFAQRREPFEARLLARTELDEARDREREQRQRVRVVLLGQRFDAALAAAREERGRPLAALVEGEDRRASEGRAREGGGREGAVVFDELHAFVLDAELARRAVAQPQAVAEPQEHLARETAGGAREGAQARDEHALELEQRLARDHDRVELARAQSGARQTVAGGAPRERGIAAPAREPRFARGGDRPALDGEHGRGVALEGREAEHARAQY